MSSSGALLIYGATGHSGRLVARTALAAGLRPLLAGRDPRRVGVLADELGLAYRVAHLGDPPALDAALRGVAVVVNTAGPFSRTAGPLLDACLRRGAHYLDITG